MTPIFYGATIGFVIRIWIELANANPNPKELIVLSTLAAMSALSAMVWASHKADQ